MKKGFSKENNEMDVNSVNSEKPKKGIAKILSEKKFTYTLPGKRQINIFAIIVLSLNFLLVMGVFLFFNNDSFHEFVFTVGK